MVVQLDTMPYIGTKVQDKQGDEEMEKDKTVVMQ